MKQTTSILAKIVLTATLATSTGAVIATNYGHNRQYAYSDDATTVRDDDDRNAGTRLSNAALADNKVRAADSPHWRVTCAMNDAQGRLSELHYVVPLHDMAFFGQVTSAITGNGLTINYADGLFVEADADMDEPHYHFVQNFKVS